MKFKIAIVIDHPQRDLQGLMYLAEKLVKRGQKVFIVQFYEINFFLLKYSKDIDLIIFNFFRKSNLDTIIAAKYINKKVIIYDQEGASGYDGISIKNNFLKLKKNIQLVDGFLFWGIRQKKSCKNILKKFRIPSEVMGCLRFESLKKNIPKKLYKKFILVNTNFTFFPKFEQNSDKELHNATETGLIKKSEKKMVLNESIFRRDGLLKFVIKLSKHYPKKNIILRPHPFENNFFWKKNLKKYKNVKVKSGGTSIDMIKNSSHIFHIDCSTSVESYILNKKSYSLFYLIKNHKYFYKPVNSFCRKIHSEKKAIGLINDQEQKYQKLVLKKDFFFNLHKKNNLMTAINFIDKICKKKNKKKLNIKLKFTKKIITLYYIKKVLGVRLYDYLMSIIKGYEYIKIRKIKEIQKKDIKLNSNFTVNKLDRSIFLIT
ncbi:Surface carbohydrate biosynthesis protein [Candidatus Pelagibacterales bacterium]